MKKIEVVQKILGERFQTAPLYSSGKSFAPSNIALCKYWGKRDTELNLPMTSSLSISLADKGATTELTIASEDSIFLNQQAVDVNTAFSQRLFEFLNLFRQQGLPRLRITIESNIPIAAGLASSACGFSALIQALNTLFGWALTKTEMSVLARLGSGSASRSLWQGFVEWHVGERTDGMDSVGVKLPQTWKDLCVGLLLMSDQTKPISSRDAMERTVKTSALYSAWPAKVASDLVLLKQAIETEDFDLLGKTSESNAMTMHATMLSAWPAVTYCLPETLSAMRRIWQLREEGFALYFTQDAGPNLKLLFLQQHQEKICAFFPQIEVIKPF